MSTETISSALREWLCKHGYSGGVNCNNLRIIGSPFEMDFVQIAPSLYFNEYEIKVSQGDYLRDFKKRNLVGYRAGSYISKHGAYSGAEPIKYPNDKHPFAIPKRFYFVAPVGVLASVPSHCGLIEFDHTSGFTIKTEPPANKLATKLTAWQVFNIMQWRSHKMTTAAQPSDAEEEGKS